jgi:hypothetical protein
VIGGIDGGWRLRNRRRPTRPGRLAEAEAAANHLAAMKITIYGWSTRAADRC